VATMTFLGRYGANLSFECNNGEFEGECDMRIRTFAYLQIIHTASRRKLNYYVVYRSKNLLRTKENDMIRNM
jgi:hypothetical protein